MNEQSKEKKRILREDDGKRIPPTAPVEEHKSKGEAKPARSEQGPDVPPEERTMGIP